MIDINNFDAIEISLASSKQIRSWSSGEVTKPETINYRTLKPEKDGLFCERIFGPTKDWECYCGKYKRVRYKGIVCERCGVEVTRSKVRRERMGHIDLAAPVSHIWFFKGVPSRIGYLLDMAPKELEKVLYFAASIVTWVDDEARTKDLDSLEKEVQKVLDSYTAEKEERVLELRESLERREEYLRTGKQTGFSEEDHPWADGLDVNVQKQSRAVKRLKVVSAFINSDNKPEHMILEAVPVIPPELRPMVQLDGGRFATSDLNDLYRRVINRNNRLKRLLDLGAPEIIVNNEKRMLQEAVDALFDNGRRGRAVTGPGNRPLKSLSDMLKGKQGRFRQNLLGKRVDYSGRSVIVVGPQLKLHQCGLPKQMALELFKPFVMKRLVDLNHAQNIKSAKRMVEREGPAFSSDAEARMAYDNGELHLQATVKIRLKGITGVDNGSGAEAWLPPEDWSPGDQAVVETTLGRVLFNETLPDGYRFVNYEIRKGQLSAIVNDLAERFPKVALAATLDALKEAGFHWATWSGVTIGMEDVVQPPRKREILERYEKEAERIDKQYQRGLMTAEERRGELIEIWTKATNEVAKEMETALPKENPLWKLINSGARGNLLQLRQISAIRGLLANPKGEIIARPT